jgi:protein-disulfide isomerase
MKLSKESKSGTTAKMWSVIWLLAFTVACGCLQNGYAQSRTGVDGNTEVAAVINGQRKITLKEIDKQIGLELQSLQERINTLRMRALNNLVTQLLLENEAKAKGVTVEQLKKGFVPESVEVKQSQVDEIYTLNANRFPSLSEDEAKQRIKMDLENRAKFEAYQAALAGIRDKAKVEVFLSEPVGPTIKVDDSGPSKGSQNAAVTVVEFSDFQCPFCKQANGTLKQLLASYGNNVRLVFKHMPLPNHPQAFKAAQAAVCAGEQGKFWEYQDTLFEHSGDLSTDALKRYSANLGLKANEFNTCLDSEASRTAVMKDMQEARQVGVRSTPTFFVNGKAVRGAKKPEEFRAIIDRELKANISGNSSQPQTRREGQ